MKPLSRKDMALNQIKQRHQNRRAKPDLISKRRCRKINAFRFKTSGLTVERNVYTKLGLALI